MSDRILKDIRYYESDKPNVEGKSMPGNIGRIFQPTKDTNYIGQRIARKLNELKYSFGEYDHLYINLTTVLSSPLVATPVAVRYAFKDFIVGELFSTEGYPVSSFRTDNW